MAEFIAQKHRPVAVQIIIPIQERRLKKIKNKMHNEEMQAKLGDSESELYLTSTYILNLQSGPFGDEPLTNTLCYCSGCLRFVLIGEECRLCNGSH